MKKYLLFIFLTFTFFSISNVIFAQDINIPDANFKNRLIAAGVDKNGDGIIQVNEALAVNYLNLDSAGISSLDGIENFKNLQTLICSNNKISTLNIGSLTNLTNLDCSWNNLTILDISALRELTDINFRVNKVSNFYFSNSENLKYIDCSYNSISNLNVSGLINLEHLDCQTNNLSSLNVNNLSKLKYLSGHYNKLSNINISGLTQLLYLDISQNQISTIDLNGLQNLETLYCYRNNLTNINVNELAQLKDLSVYLNKLSSIEISNLHSLKEFNCDNNLLSNIDLSGVNQLEILSFSWNNITQLDVSNLTNLRELNFYFNQVKELDVSKLSNLEVLGFVGNPISVIDLSHSNSLKQLSCSSTPISQLDVSNLKFLNYLNTAGTQIKSLDLTQNRLLERSDLSSSYIEVIYLKNGVNTKITDDGDIPIYIFNDVPNLKFICADSIEVEALKAIAVDFGYSNVIINSFCNSSSGGTFYTLEGKATYDINNDGCSETDKAFPNLKIKISNGVDTGFVISGNEGNFSLYANSDTLKFEPILEHPDYFSITPTSATYTLPDTVSPAFCIAPKGDFNDLAVSIIPVRAARPGFSDATYKIVYKNQGTTTQNGTVTFHFDDDKMNVISSTPTADQSDFGLLTFNFSNLSPFESKSALVTMRTNAPIDNPTVNVNDVLNFSANISAQIDETPDDNTAILYQTVIGSYDPNDKTCLEGDIITPDLVGKRINYLIRFENTGTAPAENVVVTDYIDTTVFEVNSLLITDASHTCHTQISNGNKVQFIFSDIQLPFTEPDKHGFVAFSILLKDHLQIGDSIKNQADIYFDYNLPITTNEAVSEVKNRVITTVRQRISDIQLSVYPNPSKGNFSVELNSNKTAPVQISVVDIEGKIVFAKQYTAQQNLIPIQLEKLPKGTYLIQAQSENDIISRKIVIQ